MKTSLALTLVSMFTASVYALPDYDPFADATGSGGTDYAVGANLVGQKNAQGQTWLQAGPTSTTTPKIAAGNLTYLGLPPSQGNSVSFGGSGESARLNTSSVVGSGTIYYSFILDVTSIAGLSTSGVFWAGFNNSAGSQTTTPSVVATRLYTKTSGSGFVLGVDKNSASTSDWYWDTTTRNVGDSLFIVGAYELNSGSTSDDVSYLWINPTVGSATAPSATLTAPTGADITLGQVASFVLFDRSAAQPSGIIDELRIGTSWAEVTGVPEPTSAALAGLGLLALVLRYRSRRH
jgi:hypothetical protein